MKLTLYWIDAFTRDCVRRADRRGIFDSVVHVHRRSRSLRTCDPGQCVRACPTRHDMSNCVEFSSASGPLAVSRDGERLVRNFPARPAVPSALAREVGEALRAPPWKVLQAAAMMVVFKTEEELRALRPNMDAVLRLPGYGLVATAPGEDCDFVARFFAPQVGVPEDPVTGSNHCTLIPYWSAQLGKPKRYARQLSVRGGKLWCEARKERVTIAGHCALNMRGEIEA